MKKISIAGSTQYEWGDRILPDLGLDDVDPNLHHDRRGLLTRDREFEGPDPTFGLTLNPSVKLDNYYTIFGTVIEGMEVLDAIESVPVYTFDTGGDEAPVVKSVFSGQKSLFLELGKVIGDERAVDRRGSFLKRVEVLEVKVL